MKIILFKKSYSLVVYLLKRMLTKLARNIGPGHKVPKSGNEKREGHF